MAGPAPYFLTNSGNRIIKDDGWAFVGDPTQVTSDSGARAENTQSPRTDSSSRIEVLGTIVLGQLTTRLLTESGFHIVTESGFMLVPDPHFGAEQSLEILAGLPIDSKALLETVGTDQIDTSHDAPMEIVNVAMVDGAGNIEITNYSYVSVGVPAEWKLALEIDIQINAEAAGTLSVTSASDPSEHLVNVPVSSKSPLVFSGTLAVNLASVIEALIAVRSDTPTVALEETLVVRQDTGITAVEHTFDVAVRSPVPLERTFDVRQLFMVPVQMTSKLQLDAVAGQIEFKGLLLVDSKVAAERVCTSLVDSAMRAEILGTDMRDSSIPADPVIVTMADTPLVDERLATETALTPAPITHDGGIAPSAHAPVEASGTLQVDRADPAEYRTWLLSNTGWLAETLATVRQDRTVPMEAAGSVSGLTPLGAAYSATLAVDRSVPAEALAGVAAATAAAMELVGQVMHANSAVRTEWRGALRVDLPVPAETAAKLMRDTPSRINITMDVHRDEGEPIAFYGYTLIPQITLQGSKVAVQLDGSKVAVDLEGSKVQILLVGQIT